MKKVDEAQPETVGPIFLDNEKWFDKNIAPSLLSLCNDCKDRGIHFFATVEHAPGEYSETSYVPAGSDLAIVMMKLIAHSHNNFDSFIINFMRYCKTNKIDLNSSIMMRAFFKDD